MQSQSSEQSHTGSAGGGTLFVVATPIGNLADLSSRQRDTLAAADCIAAEDTRHTGRLLAHLGVRVPLLSLHEHNERARIESLLGRLRAGERVALVCDAGTPLISDPGYQLVHAARRAGYPVTPVPGPCAAVTALSAAGLPSDRFVFEGFLPARAAQRRRRLQALAGEPRTLIFYAAVHRLEACLADLAAELGAERPAVVARELTKRHEQILDGSLETLAQAVRDGDVPARGECVLVVGGQPAPDRTSDDDETEDAGQRAEARRVLALVAARLPGRDAVELAAAITGERRNRLKRWMWALEGTGEGD